MHHGLPVAAAEGEAEEPPRACGDRGGRPASDHAPNTYTYIYIYI